MKSAEHVRAIKVPLFESVRQFTGRDNLKITAGLSIKMLFFKTSYSWNPLRHPAYPGITGVGRNTGVVVVLRNGSTANDSSNINI